MSTAPWMLAWIEREAQLKALAEMAEADYRAAETPLEQDQCFNQWQAVVRQMITHKKNMPPRIKAAREAAALKRARQPASPQHQPAPETIR